jgi:hypothetical protein
MTTFKINNPLESLEESGLAGLVVNDSAVASPNVIWTSSKIASLPAPPGAMALVPAAVSGDIAQFGVGGQVVDSGKLTSNVMFVPSPLPLAGNLAQFTITGQVVDSGKAATGLVAAPSPSVLGDIPTLTASGQIVDSGRLLTALAVQPAFAKYSAPVQAIGTSAATILFATPVGASSLVGPTGQIAIAAGIVTLTSLGAVATSWEVDFNPNFISNALSTTVTFQFQTPTGTNAGNTSQKSNYVSPNIASDTGIIREFITVPASSSSTFSISAISSAAGSSLGLASSLSYVSIKQIQ